MNSSLLNQLLILFLLTTFACQTQDRNSQQTAQATGNTPVLLDQVAPPLPESDVPFQHFSIKAETEQTIDLDNGTRIKVPANAFVDAQNRPIAGEVDLDYREFHDAVDVLFSGIPMHMQDQSGEMQIFQTAGMMEIRATQNDQEVFIKEGEAIEVEMASYQNALAETQRKGYGQFYFDEESHQWQTLQEMDLPQDNPRSQPLMSEADLPPKPAPPRKPADETNVFNFAVDYSSFPALAEYKDIVWEYAGIIEEGLVNPNQAEWLFTEAWRDAQIAPRQGSKDVYYISLSSPRRQAKICVRPVISERDFSKAMAVFNKINARYAKQRQRLQEEQERVRNQSLLVSVFQVMRLGIYNIDRYLKDLGEKQVAAQIAMGDAQSVHIGKKVAQTVYHMIPEANAVIPYTYWKSTGNWTWNGTDFQYYTHEKNYLVTISEDGQLLAFTPEDFAQNQIGNSFTFVLKPMGKASAKTLRGMINS
jgi:hypothetical protein